MTSKGIGGHQLPVNATDVWLTPPDILQKLGRFDLDPCACSQPRPWSTADFHFTKEDDGLNQDWFGRVWLNPPYGGPSIIGPWMRKLVAHGYGTALIFARTETEMFHDAVWNAATAVLFFRGRLHFYSAVGVRAPNNAGAPSCLVAYGDFDARLLEGSMLNGKFLRLR